jgi:Pyruvate carboxylase
MPDYGKIMTYRSAAGFGVRLDAANASSGSIITPYYDSLLVKVTTWAKHQDDCIKRMDRALREFRIRGVKTNLVFLESLINNNDFLKGNYNTNFVDTKKELYTYKPQKDRASKIVSYLGNIIVNGHSDISGRPNNSSTVEVQIPISNNKNGKNNFVEDLKKLGSEKFAKKIKEIPYTLITDTTMRDAHQSLLASKDKYR